MISEHNAKIIEKLKSNVQKYGFICIATNEKIYHDVADSNIFENWEKFLEDLNYNFYYEGKNSERCRINSCYVGSLYELNLKVYYVQNHSFENEEDDSDEKTLYGIFLIDSPKILMELPPEIIFILSVDNNNQIIVEPATIDPRNLTWTEISSIFLGKDIISNKFKNEIEEYGILRSNKNKTEQEKERQNTLEKYLEYNHIDHLAKAINDMEK